MVSEADHINGYSIKRIGISDNGAGASLHQEYTYRYGRDHMKERNTMNDLSSSSPPPSGDGLNEIIAQMMMAPFEIMVMQLEAIILREWEIACSIFNKHAKEADDVYLGHVEKYKGMVRNTVDGIYES